MEKRVQGKIIRAFKDAGWYVIKTRPGPGVPKGMLDVLALRGGSWAVVECKAYSDSAWQALQEYTFEKFAAWTWTRVAHSGNVDEICQEIAVLDSK